MDFSLIPAPVDVQLNKVTDTSDANGIVVTTVNSRTTATVFRVLATLHGGDISTPSDTVVVTTGLPVQRSFTLGSSLFNVEGWDINSPSAAFIQVALADQFSHPVPDGTPVVFETNLGAIGSSNRGGCLTINGGCSVDFRAQEPRVAQQNIPVTPCNTGHEGSRPDLIRPGMATICASTTDGEIMFFKEMLLFLSGSYPLRTRLNGTLVSLDAANDLGVIGVDASVTFQLQINDVNDNPMPQGTTVAFAGTQNVAARDILPATVPNIAPHSSTGDDKSGVVEGPQGSIHTISIANAAPSGCTGSVPALFYVVVTTPKGFSTGIPFRAQVACK